MSAVSSFQLPPWLTKKIMQKRLTTADDILLEAREEILRKIGEQATINNVSFDAKLSELKNDNDIPHSNLLRHLHDFATLPKAIPSCLGVATSMAAQETQEQLHDALCAVKRTMESASVVPGGGSVEAPYCPLQPLTAPYSS